MTPTQFTGPSLAQAAGKGNLTFTLFHLLNYLHCCVILILKAVYAYTDASDAFPGERARLVSPILGDTTTERCLNFNYLASGEHVGHLRVLDGNNAELWDVDPGLK